MKKNVFCIVALIIAAIVSVTVVSCKKDKDEVVKATNSEAQALLNRIEAFQTLRDAVNSGAKADGRMTVEEMRQILDLVSNYEHSEHETYCENTILDTLHFRMATVDGEGLVSESDVVATYNAFETALEKRMLAVEDGMDVPSYFSIVMPEIGAKDDGDIDVVFLRGESAFDNNDVRNPFEEGDDYVWGLGLGLCNPTGPFNCNTDAAQELSKLFRFRPDAQHDGQNYIISNVEHASFTPHEDNIYFPHYYYYEDTTITCSNTWLFYLPGDYATEPCIPFYEMNCYFHNIRKAFTLVTSPFYNAPRNHSPYHECCIEAIRAYYPGDGEKRPFRIHVAHVTYCNVIWSEPYLPPVD